MEAARFSNSSVNQTTLHHIPENYDVSIVLWNSIFGSETVVTICERYGSSAESRSC